VTDSGGPAWAPRGGLAAAAHGAGGGSPGSRAPGTHIGRTVNFFLPPGTRLPCRGAGLGDGMGRAGPGVLGCCSPAGALFFLLSCRLSLLGAASATRQVQVSSVKTPRLCRFAAPLCNCLKVSVDSTTTTRRHGYPTSGLCFFFFQLIR
jgi:hypothetical protein